jgi:glutaconate CoA-transferase, subunit B
MAEILPLRKAISDRLHDGDIDIVAVGHLDGGSARQRLGLQGKGPVAVITDLCIMEPGEETKELTATHLHPGVARRQVEEATGWPIRFADMIKETSPPAGRELETLRDTERHTAIAHGRGSAKAEEGRGSLAPRK